MSDCSEPVFVLMDELRTRALAVEDCEVERDMTAASHASQSLANTRRSRAAGSYLGWIDGHQSWSTVVGHHNNAKARSVPSHLNALGLVPGR